MCVHDHFRKIAWGGRVGWHTCQGQTLGSPGPDQAQCALFNPKVKGQTLGPDQARPTQCALFGPKVKGQKCARTGFILTTNVPGSTQRDKQNDLKAGELGHPSSPWTHVPWWTRGWSGQQSMFYWLGSWTLDSSGHADRRVAFPRQA